MQTLNYKGHKGLKLAILPRFTSIWSGVCKYARS